jgi:hypothetical protein
MEERPRRLQARRSIEDKLKSSTPTIVKNFGNRTPDHAMDAMRLVAQMTAVSDQSMIRSFAMVEWDVVHHNC